MKFFSDLRLTNSQLTEQITALMLAGVAAVVIGGVAHMSAHRHDSVDDQQTAAIAALDQSEAAAPRPMLAPQLQASQQQPAQAPQTAIVAPAPASALSSSSISPALQQLATAAREATQKPEQLVRAAELGRGDTFASLLTDADLSDEDARAVMQAIGTVYSIKKLPRGLEVSMRFTRLGSDETFDGLTFQPEAASEIRVTRLDNGAFKAQKVVTPLERQRFAVEGKINSSLYEAGAAHGVPRSVMAAMIRAFSHEIDFQRDLSSGDTFRVLYDQPRAKNGQPAGDATIIFASLNIDGKTRSVYRVLYSDGTAEYFNDSGESVKRGLMRTPVDGARMASNFGMRRHPILGYTKFHKGVDFAAPTGTPIYAAGDGIVTEIGFKSGYGRFIMLRHGNNLETAYGHMSRFARGLVRGSRVQQGEVIAFVGQTGRATGPHLHFETHVNGQPVSPLSINMRSRRALEGKQLAQFTKGKGMIEKEFKRVSLSALDKQDGPDVKMASVRPRLGAE